MSDIPKTSELPYADNLMILDDGICYAWFRVKIVAKETGLKRFENAEDNIYYDTNRIYMVDEKGNIQGYVHEPERIIVCGTDGTDVYLLGQGEKSWFIEKVDTEGKLSDKQDVFGIGCLGEIKSGQYQFDGIELYYIFENALWKYIPQYGTNERILNLSDFGIIQERITCFQKLSDGFGFIVNNDKESIFIEIVQGKTERDGAD